MEFQMIRLERIIGRREINSWGCLKWLFLKVHTSEHEWPRKTTSNHEWEFTKIYFFCYNDIINTSLIKLRLLNRKELISGDNKNRTWNISFPFPKGRARTKWDPGVIVWTLWSPLLSWPFLVTKCYKTPSRFFRWLHLEIVLSTYITSLVTVPE